MSRLLPAVLIAFAAATAAKAAPTCHGLAASAITFTAYDVYSAGQQSVRGTITYNCPPPLSATVPVTVKVVKAEPAKAPPAARRLRIVRRRRTIRLHYRRAGSRPSRSCH